MGFFQFVWPDTHPNVLFVKANDHEIERTIMRFVGNVFWLPIRQSKFFGTIEFSVSIYGKILVILSPNLDILYRSLDFKYIQICRPFAPWKISPINL